MSPHRPSTRGPGRCGDPSLPHRRAREIETVLDWSEWCGSAGAVEMCNDNGACRKLEPGVTCPSYRVTGDEMHLTRGRERGVNPS